MKSSRLWTYAILGIIGGLLFENKFLRVQQDVKEKRYALKERKQALQKEAGRLKRKLAKATERG